MAGEQKGVISGSCPSRHAFLPDGTPVDIILNPLGVPKAYEYRSGVGDSSGLGCQPFGVQAETRCSMAQLSWRSRASLRVPGWLTVPGRSEQTGLGLGDQPRPDRGRFPG